MQVTLDYGPGEVAAGTTNGGADAAVTTFDSGGTAVNQGFYTTIYGASNSG
jgi:hypothetical protein